METFAKLFERFLVFVGSRAGANCSVGSAYLFLSVSVEVGIELGRANGEVEGSQSRPFGCEVAAHFHQRHVFRGPPIIPDGGVSPVRFEVFAFLP